ncbi:site-2 protease family protein [Thermodesulfobacteriota bacterium]
MPLNIEELLITVPIVLFSITIHEYSHGKAALSLGDPTAKNAGRLTLNPISHIDPIGAICLLLFHFGWAKPVPVDARYFQNPRRDIVLMALSGPVANFAAAFLAGLFFRYFPMDFIIYQKILLYIVIFNIALGLFNLLPIPPLDGSHVLENLLPPRASEKFRKVRRFAPFILIGVLLMDRFFQTGILGKLLETPIKFLTKLLIGA